MINSLLQVGTNQQALYIFNELIGCYVDISNLPESLPPYSVGWYATTLVETPSSTGNYLVYQDFDLLYDYRIYIRYEFTTTYNSNTYAVCEHVTITKNDKLGNPTGDTILPYSIIDNALDTLPIMKINNMNTGRGKGMNMNKINRLQTQCSPEALHIIDRLEERQIDTTTLPTTLSVDTIGWYVTTVSGTTVDNLVVYQDFVTYTDFNYEIRIQYQSTGTACNSNPVLDCSCITLSITDKLGNSIVGTFPDTIIKTAMDTLPVVKVCDDDDNELFNDLDRKKIDISKIPFVVDINTVTVDGWYRTTDSVTGKEILVYIEISDPNENYEIDIHPVQNNVPSCADIKTEISDKSGNPVVGSNIPTTVKARAISTLPISCGTGMWDGCTAGIQNKYLIAGGVGILAILIIAK